MQPLQDSIGEQQPTTPAESEGKDRSSNDMDAAMSDVLGKSSLASVQGKPQILGNFLHHEATGSEAVGGAQLVEVKPAIPAGEIEDLTAAGRAGRGRARGRGRGRGRGRDVEKVRGGIIHKLPKRTPEERKGV